MNYPYQKQFQDFLRDQKKLAPLTVQTYETSLTNFFSYLLANRPAFAHDPGWRTSPKATSGPTSTCCGPNRNYHGNLQ